MSEDFVKGTTKYVFPLLLGSGCWLNMAYAVEIKPIAVSTTVTEESYPVAVNSSAYADDAKTLNELLLSTPKPVQQLQAKTTTPPPNHLASNNRQVVKTTDITRVDHEA